MEKVLKCPNCGSEEFRGEAVGYDIVKITNEKIEVIRSDSYDCNQYYCNDCDEEIDNELVNNI